MITQQPTEADAEAILAMGQRLAAADFACNRCYRNAPYVVTHKGYLYDCEITEYHYGKKLLSVFQQRKLLTRDYVIGVEDARVE